MSTTPKRADVTGFEVISLDGRDRVTLDISSMVLGATDSQRYLFDMPVAVAKVLAADLRAAVRRAAGK